jgi:gluconolactonase
MIAPGAAVEKLWSGAEWAEGPAWVAHTQTVLFSDIPNDRIMEFDPLTNEARVHRENAEFANGRTVDREGRIVQCSHGRRAIERETHGVVETLVAEWEGGRFNSPNDVVVAADGAIWFTDPPYGLHESGREGHPGTQDYDGCFVFRVHEGVATPVITDMVHPNGLAFSPDESKLYVADTGWFWNKSVPLQIRVYDVSTATGRLFVEPHGVADGFRVDAEGRLWTSSGDAVVVYSPDAELLLTLRVPERVSNVCFGGPDGHDLYITATTSLYRVRTTTSGAPRPGVG